MTNDELKQTARRILDDINTLNSPDLDTIVERGVNEIIDETKVFMETILKK